MLWLHASTPLRLAFVTDVAGQILARRDDLGILCTFDPATVSPAPDSGGLFDALVPLPGAGNGASRHLVAGWRPQVGIWTGGDLNTALIRQAQDAGTQMILVDADPAGLRGRRRRWFSDPLQDALDRFVHVLASSKDAADLLRRSGRAAERIEIAPPIRLCPSPPDCPDEEVVAVAQLLAGRPAWLAAFTHPDEFGFLVTAQRNAVRLAHRLLLTVVLEDRQHRGDLLDLLDAMTLRHAVWHLGDPIDDSTQVLVADDPDDLGLWYRVAPQTFMGHSLIPGESGRSPMDAAALGSAILHGPHVGAHAEAYRRLTRAGAAQLVVDGNALGQQVVRLIAPDVAASMALAGWEVATEGAELSSRVIELIEEQLAAGEAARARS